MKILASTFKLEDISFKWIDSGNKIQVTQDYRFRLYIELHDKRRIARYYCINKGFISDGGSIPKWIYNIPFTYWLVGARFGGDTMASFVIHDFFYKYNLVSRDFADSLMLFIAKKGNVSFKRRQIIYNSVRLGGQSAWNNHKKDLVNK